MSGGQVQVFDVSVSSVHDDSSLPDWCADIRRKRMKTSSRI